MIKTLGPEDGTKDSPAVIAINRKTNRVYVSNVGGEDGPLFKPDMVTVIDGKTDTIVTNVVVGDHPFGLAVDQKANPVYVANVGGTATPLVAGRSWSSTARRTPCAKSSTFPPPGAHLPFSTSPSDTGLPGYLAYDPETGYLWVANTAELREGEQDIDCCTILASSRSTTRRRSSG